MKRRMWKASAAMAAVTVASTIVFAQRPPNQGPPPGIPMDSSWSQIVSATVVATMMVRILDGANSLNLMVLWRGSNATFLLAQGVDPWTIMETLGHSQISLTLSTYSHVLPSLQRESAVRMNELLVRRA